jgi:hypothetical protein
MLTEQLMKGYPAGWLTANEANELQRLAIGKRVVEIGAWKGRSTVVLSQVAEHVISIDHFKGDDYAGRFSVRNHYFESLNQFRCQNVTTIIADSFDACKMIDSEIVRNGNIHLFFYDADHTKLATEKALIQGLRWECPVIAIHDYSPAEHFRGVCDAVNEFVKETGYIFHLVDHLAILHRAGWR